jgi:predicted nucleotidyltransferase
MTQTQSIQQVQMGQVQYHASHTCIFMWLNRYPVSIKCETWSRINPHTSPYYYSVFHTNDTRLETVQSFNNIYRVSQFKSSTQIIHKIFKLKEQNDTNQPIHKIK